MKKLFSILVIAALFYACSNNKTNISNVASSDQKACASISVDSFLMIAGDNVGKELTVEGTVDHVCKHGGKRVKLISTGSAKFIHGEASEKMGAFNAELEGSDVCLTGTVIETKIDIAYVDEWEAKEREAIAKNAEESEMAHKEGLDHHANLEQIKKYREEIAVSEKGYISFYALEVDNYHECASTGNDGCGKKADSSEVSIRPSDSERSEAGACGGCKEKKSGCGDGKEKTENTKPCCEKK